MVQLILAAIFVVFLFYYYAIKPLNYWKERGVKQYKPKWLFGDTWTTVFQKESIGEMLINLYNATGRARYLGIYQFTTPVLFIKDLDLVKQIGIKDFDHFMDHRSVINEDSDPLVAKNLFSITGQKWKDLRAVLTPSFTASKLKTMYHLITECGETFANFFVKKNQDSMEIEMKDVFLRYCNDVITSIAFGIKMDSLEEPDNEFFLTAKTATNFNGFWVNVRLLATLIFPKLCTFLRVPLFDRYVRQFFFGAMDETIKTREEKQIVRPDMIHLLLEARKEMAQKAGKTAIQKLSNIDIAAQAMLYYLAGFDSVSTTMCFMGYELALNPDIQKRLRAEVEETLKKCNGKVTYEEVGNMKYMDMVLSETLRKWTVPAPVDRVCTKPYTIPPVNPDEKPIHLQKGSVIWFPAFAFHRDPNIYSNPEQFDPERFNDENKDKINPCAYLPFGVGPRSCIGFRFGRLEIKVVFIYLLANFELTPCAKTQIPIKLAKNQFGLAYVNNFWVNLKRVQK
ncbi:cytochrome P450 9e2-like [Diabrotica undecimpunctata]|uniref:cytochrome P450 9e2-like n=1 Tax=Diabrotica undecimpunctata TaxID=50387 RepID=UPI003B63754E